jgi:hypothetical protein
MFKIAIYDGSRNRLNTGYGALSRGIIRALVLKGCEVYLQDSQVPFDKEVPYQAEISVLPSIKEAKDFDSMDLVFQIGTPPSAMKLPKHTLMYTQNALGDLIDNWIKPLRKVDGLIVPGEFDANVFRKYFDRVYTCPQYVDTHIFNYRPTYRKEGSSMFTFMFVGSYGYRKGTDLLVEAFCKAFRREDEVELIFYCVTGLETGFNHVLEIIQKYNPLARIKLFSSFIRQLGWQDFITARMLLSLYLGVRVGVCHFTKHCFVENLQLPLHQLRWENQFQTTLLNLYLSKR